MDINEIRSVLCDRKTSIDASISNVLAELKAQFLQNKDEQGANSIWCYEEILKIQLTYLGAYRIMHDAYQADDTLIDDYDSCKSKKYEYAWNELDQCDINISFLEKNFCIPGMTIDDFHVGEILRDIKLLQPLFPYKIFTSRETVIKSQRCSICGRDISVRNSCAHIPGKLYNGTMCVYEITDFQFISENIVTRPFDKYAILKIKGIKFDFSLLDYIVPHIYPYKKWSYRVEKRLFPQYKKIGRNEKCPCGSGLKFKRCIRDNREKHLKKHYIFSV